VLTLSTAILIGRARIRTFEKIESLGLLIFLTLLPTVIYLYGFSRDSGEISRRMISARQLEQLRKSGARSIGVERDPAPYRLPPVNLFEWIVVKLPKDFDLKTDEPMTDVVVRPVDVLDRFPPPSRAYIRLSSRDFEDVFPARISWANKPLEIWVRKELIQGQNSEGRGQK
jgi:hypothetical protein